MTSGDFASIGVAKSQLRDRIVGNYQRAQRLIDVAAASSSASGHAAIIAYDKACGRLRSEIERASRSFPDPDGMVAWLLEGFPKGALSEKHRNRFALVIKTMVHEVERAHALP